MMPLAATVQPLGTLSVGVMGHPVSAPPRPALTLKPRFCQSTVRQFATNLSFSGFLLVTENSCKTKTPAFAGVFVFMIDLFYV